jgi:hypothetical protein
MTQEQKVILERGAVVAALKGLQEEIDGETDITRILAPLPVFLWDVCQALGFSQAECDEVLGRAGAFVRRWLECGGGENSCQT